MKQARLAMVLLSAVLSTNALYAETSKQSTNWLTERFGRLLPHPGFWSAVESDVLAFQPSGVGENVYRFGDYSVLHNHGLYWSSSDEPDTSKDMHASVMVFKGQDRIFVARGYRYFNFESDAGSNTFSFSHWTGLMGDEQMTTYTFDSSRSEWTVTKATTTELE